MLLLFGDCALDPARRELCRGGEAVHIEPQVFDLLLHLIENRDHVVSKDDLLSAVWQGRIVSESTLSTRINAARSAIGDSGERQQLIRTVARRGLRFVGEVKQEPIEPRNPDATTRASDGRPAIAVLPFANMSGDPTQDYFSDGISEDIITDLSRWHRLAVQSRSASFRYRGAAVDLARVARELNVRYIVEGSVRRLGERIRISAQLIDTETGNHVWAERFDREIADVFKVQDEVAQTIVSTLVGRVQAADAERARRKPPASLAAYECVLHGNALPWNDPGGAAEATRLFEQAIEIDPGYGFAHALLAVMRYREWRDDLCGSSDAALNEAHRLATRAVELAGNESTCFSILSQVCLLRRSFDLALQHMRRAIEINATNQWNTADMGSVISYVGRAAEALAWFKRAKEIDPYFDAAWYQHNLGLAHLILRNYEQALEEFERSSTRPYRIAAYMAGCHGRLGATSRARALASECLEKKPDFTIGRWIAKEPFKDPADAAHLAECLRAAGMPE